MRQFTYEHSPVPFWPTDRWLVRDPQGDAVEFESESAAKAASELWEEKNGALVFIDWENAPEDADDSHRGYYTVRIKGMKWSKTIACGWHSDAAAARLVLKLRNAIAKHGIEAARSFLSL